MGRRRANARPAPRGPAWERWLRWAVVGLALFVSAWWVYDGLRALIVGDYVTPRSGAYEGELGQWADIVKWAGIDPRATAMKVTFVVAGLAWASLTLSYLLRPWLWRWLVLAAAFALWYAQVGTIAGLLEIVGLLVLHDEGRERKRLEARRGAGPG